MAAATPVWEQAGPATASARAAVAHAPAAAAQARRGAAAPVARAKPVGAARPQPSAGTPRGTQPQQKEGGDAVASKGPDTRLVHLERSPAHGFGMQIVGVTEQAPPDSPASNFIAHITPGSPADVCGRLLVGDEILAVDGHSVQGKTHAECLALFSRPGAAGAAKPWLRLTVAANPDGWRQLCEETKPPKPKSPAAQEKKTAQGTSGAGASPSRGRGGAAAAAAAQHPSPSPSPSAVDVHRSTLSSSVVEVEQSVAGGIAALRGGRYEEAESKFLEALHPVLDPAVQSAIVNASRLPPDEARAECARIVDLERQQKGGANYLLALALLRQRRDAEAADPLAAAAKQTVGWLLTGGTRVDPCDARLHHAVGQSLAASGKVAVAEVAIEEALALSYRRSWVEDLNAVRARLGLGPVPPGKTFCLDAPPLPRSQPVTPVATPLLVPRPPVALGAHLEGSGSGGGSGGDGGGGSGGGVGGGDGNSNAATGQSASGVSAQSTAPQAEAASASDTPDTDNRKHCDGDNDSRGDASGGVVDGVATSAVAAAVRAASVELAEDH